MAFFMRWFGPRLALPVLIALVVGALGLTAWLVWPSGQGAQVKHSAAIAGAMGQAGASAVQITQDRNKSDMRADQEASAIVEGIKDAEDADAVRAAVLAGLCQKPSYSNDPACKMQPTRP